MLNKEIEELKTKISISLVKNQDKEDEMLASLSYQPGWEVLKLRVNKKINALLEPGTKSEDLAFIGAVTMARELAIESLRSIISDVENSKKVSKIEVSDTVQE